MWYHQSTRSPGRLQSGRPAEVARVDVGREPLLEPVQLVGADEVHLPAQARAVALEPEVVREGRNRRGETPRSCRTRSVRDGSAPVMNALARARRAGSACTRSRRRRPPRRAGRSWESSSPVAVGAEEERRELVDHHDEDVRPLAHRTRRRYRLVRPAPLTALVGPRARRAPTRPRGGWRARLPARCTSPRAD